MSQTQMKDSGQIIRERKPGKRGSRNRTTSGSVTRHRAKTSLQCSRWGKGHSSKFLSLPHWHVPNHWIFSLQNIQDRGRRARCNQLPWMATARAAGGQGKCAGPSASPATVLHRHPAQVTGSCVVPFQLPASDPRGLNFQFAYLLFANYLRSLAVKAQFKGIKLILGP